MKYILIGASNPETIRVINAMNHMQEKLSFDVIGFLDNDDSKRGIDFFGYPVLGGFEILDDYNPNGINFVNLITRDTKTRYETSKVISEKGFKFGNMISPDVNLEMVDIGVGNYIQDHVIIQAGCSIGNNSSIHMGALIGHETKIGNSTFIAHGCSISGKVTIGDGVFMGTNVSVCPRVKIGKWTTIGAGAVITKDVPDYATVVGNPARVIKFGETIFESGNII